MASRTKPAADHAGPSLQSVASNPITPSNTVNYLTSPSNNSLIAQPHTETTVVKEVGTMLPSNTPMLTDLNPKALTHMLVETKDVATTRVPSNHQSKKSGTLETTTPTL